MLSGSELTIGEIRELQRRAAEEQRKWVPLDSTYPTVFTATLEKRAETASPVPIVSIITPIAKAKPAGVPAAKKRRIRAADRLLDRIAAWTPIKLREELLGDIREDVGHRREQGWTEKKLRRLIWWQFGYAIVGWLWGKMESVLKLLRFFGMGNG